MAEKRKKKIRTKEIKWDKLDNTAHLFPVIAGEGMSNVYRICVVLKEEIKRELLQEALDTVLPLFPVLTPGSVRECSGIILKKTEKRRRKSLRNILIPASILNRIQPKLSVSGLLLSKPDQPGSFSCAHRRNGSGEFSAGTDLPISEACPSGTG